MNETREGIARAMLEELTGWARDLIAIGLGVWVAYRELQQMRQQMPPAPAPASLQDLHTSCKCALRFGEGEEAALARSAAHEPTDDEPAGYCPGCLAEWRLRFPTLEPAAGCVVAPCYWHRQPELLDTHGKRLLLLDGRRWLVLQSETIRN